jgi:hypothetical protein
LQYRRVTTQSHTELAAELAADTEEYRMELQVDQVSPRHAVPSAAYIPIREGCEPQVAAAIEAMPDSLQNRACTTRTRART